MITAAHFAGAWRLVSYESHQPDGSIQYPMGPDAKGLLIYTEHGEMSGQVMRRNRAALASGYRGGADVTGVMAAFDGYIAYCGTFRIDHAAGEVVHVVEASLYPNWVGGEQRRRFRFEGTRLTLSVSVRRRDGDAENRLVWEKIAANPLPGVP